MEDYAEVLEGKCLEAFFVNVLALRHRIEGLVFFVFRLDFAERGCEVVEAGEVLLGGSGFVHRLARLAFYPGDKFSCGIGEALDRGCGQHGRIIRIALVLVGFRLNYRRTWSPVKARVQCRQNNQGKYGRRDYAAYYHCCKRSLDFCANASIERHRDKA